MKPLALLYLLFCFSFSYGQPKLEHTFKFNVKKWNRDYVKHQKKEKGNDVSINLFDVYGKEISYLMSEKSISEEKLSDIKVFKGKSADGKKIISLTILKKSLNGSYLENGIQYFIEPIKSKCNTFRVYTNSPEKAGQEMDFIK